MKSLFEGVDFRPLPLVVVVAWLLHGEATIPESAAREPDTERALALALEKRGLFAQASEILWVDEPGGLATAIFELPRALVRAHRADEPCDIYLVEAQLSPEGRLLAIAGVHNLSDTSAVDEQKLRRDGQRAGWAITSGNTTYSIHYADLRGERALSGPGWTRLARWQNALTNLQDTGQSAGVGRRSFKLDPPASQVMLGFSPDALLITADGRRISIPTEPGGGIVGQRFIREHERLKARPGNLVTWAVDRARALPWFGNDRMQAVKAIAFAGLDWVERTVGTVTGDDGSERVAEDLAGLLETAPTIYTDPETGWPPAPMQTVLSRPIEGEGKWVSLDSDPFIHKNPEGPAPFVFSFIRTDRRRAYTQTYVVMWDPRQVSLHAMSGTLEPKSATGETGPGLVPRKPQVMGRLVAGFNGGFQATHGEFGMMAEGIIYLPPKPFAATVAELRDGSTGFGTWPKDEKVPDHILSFRQNMTPLVLDGVVNPYKRDWWGGVPPGWTDESRTVRSGVCLTKEGFVAYLYGSSIDADHLAVAMKQARCVYGIHLDMNPGHTGFEFYRVAPLGGLPNLGRELDATWEAKGAVVGMPGWEFLGRRMIRYMGLMNFPRYVNRESRDFFYLTLRHVLPGDSLATSVTPAEPGEGLWQVKGLPQHGWPYVIATSWLRADPSRTETKVNLLKLDPSALRLANESDDQPVVVLRTPEKDGRGTQTLWLGTRGFVIAAGPSEPSAQPITAGFSPGDAGAANASAAIGIGDADGMLIYAEIATAPQPGADSALLDGLLARIGCSRRLLLERSLGVAIGGERDLAGHPVGKIKSGVRLVRASGPTGRRIFTDTPVVPVKEWYNLQAKRVRYFRKTESSAEPQLSTPVAQTKAPEAVMPSEVNSTRSGN